MDIVSLTPNVCRVMASADPAVIAHFNTVQAITRSKSNLAQLVGYIPQRGDFDTEWDNEAEAILADMEFRPEDTPVEKGSQPSVYSRGAAVHCG